MRSRRAQCGQHHRTVVRRKKWRRWRAEGFKAGYIGLPEEASPYSLDTAAGQVWVIGHCNGVFWRDNWEPV